MSEKLVSMISAENYAYIAVKGSPFATDCAVFGLSREEIVALTRRFPNSGQNVINGVMIKGPPVPVINVLAELGYRVVCSTGEAEIVWTLQREI
ncbi:uncharacterized protein LOC105685395 [Athalia rosae]|uniref:uncharacterized protein LOC105685395 n=1 Tax=Athalia rosae TaxID=37344 RepID=UPI000625A58F|nr:uncharacterized protein LOC105685395 [Athalia rosae]